MQTSLPEWVKGSWEYVLMAVGAGGAFYAGSRKSSGGSSTDDSTALSTLTLRVTALEAALEHSNLKIDAHGEDIGELKTQSAVLAVIGSRIEQSLNNLALEVRSLNDKLRS